MIKRKLHYFMGQQQNCVCANMQGHGLSNQPQITIVNPTDSTGDVLVHVHTIYDLLRLEPYWISGNSQSFSCSPPPGFKLLDGAHQASQSPGRKPWFIFRGWSTISQRYWGVSCGIDLDPGGRSEDTPPPPGWPTRPPSRLCHGLEKSHTLPR